MDARIPVRELESSAGVLHALLASGAGCMLVDPAFFGPGALEVLAGLSTHGIPILVFCEADDAAGALGALRRGLFDVLVKPIRAEALVERVTLALRAEAARREREALLAPARARLATLSAREFEIMHHIAHGLLTKEIASMLRISQKTVEMFRGRILRKLEVRGVADITRLWCALRGPCEYVVVGPNQRPPAACPACDDGVRGKPGTPAPARATGEDRDRLRPKARHPEGVGPRA